MEDINYLAFGLWLQESDNGGTDTFGAFAVGGDQLRRQRVRTRSPAPRSYSGKAAGAHHRTGDGVNWFDGDASLTANFGMDDAAAGTVSGEISNIRVAGGDPMSDSIYLGQASSHQCRRQLQRRGLHGGGDRTWCSNEHEFDGTWSGSFFGASKAVEEDPDNNIEAVTAGHRAPAAAAGTFGVTKSEVMGDDMVVESFVGAFGAHKD